VKNFSGTIQSYEAIAPGSFLTSPVFANQASTDPTNGRKTTDIIYPESFTTIALMRFFV